MQLGTILHSFQHIITIENVAVEESLPEGLPVQSIERLLANFWVHTLLFSNA